MDLYEQHNTHYSNLATTCHTTLCSWHNAQKPAWGCRSNHAEKACAQREAELAEARAEAQALRDALDAERAASAAAAAALERDLQQRHATERDSALGDANAGFTRCLQEQKQHSEDQLAEQAAKLQVRC